MSEIDWTDTKNWKPPHTLADFKWVAKNLGKQCEEQSALIRELVGALKRISKCKDDFTPAFSFRVVANQALSKVPKDYL